jgi:hypothetical protein
MRVHTRFLRSVAGLAPAELGLVLSLAVLLGVAVIAVFGSSIRSWWLHQTAAVTEAVPRD